MSVFERVTPKQAWLRSFEITWNLCILLSYSDFIGVHLSDEELRKMLDVRLNDKKTPVTTDEEWGIIIALLEKSVESGVSF